MNMNFRIDKVRESVGQPAIGEANKKQGENATFQFADHRPASATQRKLQQMASEGPQASEAKKIQLMANRAHGLPRHSMQKKENHAGLPNALKSGIEALSGMDMSDVVVHRNSARPAQLNALAYAQGSEIHLGPGQDRHLPHEAWHVVQQKQGRVSATEQNRGVNINADQSLEREADAMGGKALQSGLPAQMKQAKVIAQRSPVQKKGERDAVRSTRDSTRSAGEQIRRGNRRNSITDTGGRSSAKLDITFAAPNQHFNTGYRNQVDELKDYVKTRMVAGGKYTQRQADDLIDKNMTFLQAKAVEEISVGNCGEFAMVVFAHLMQNTTNQWVYRCRMAGMVPGTTHPYDHSFAFTYPWRTNTVAGIDKDLATIADGWDGYQVMTLRQFMDRGNAYRTQLDDVDINIIEAGAATGSQVFSPEILQYITDWAVAFNWNFNREMSNPWSTYARVAEERRKNPIGFDTRGSDVVDIVDHRTVAQQLENSTDDERTEILGTLFGTDFLADIDALTFPIT